MHYMQVELLFYRRFMQNLFAFFVSTTLGQELLDVAFKHLNLLETAYFGLRYLDSTNQTHWLDPSKKAARQLKGTDPFTLYFGVKFYASDPCKLLEEITRYQFFLQVKQDVLQGRLPVAFDLAAELGAYAVQSELGDYDPRRHQPGYVAEFRFITHQTQELETRIAELHKTIIGQVPAIAELNYLEKVKWLDMYGVDLHPVLGEDNVEYFLGLTPSGVIVLRNKTKVGNYFWPRITKVYFKRKYFMLRVRDKNNDESTYGFELPSKQACKHLWKCSVEHHAFFRLTQVSSTNSGKSFSLTSRFRYSGRTERQIQSELQEQNRLQPHVTRVASRRYQRRFGQPDGIDSSLKDGNKEDEKLETQSNISIPRPIHLPTSIYKSTSMPGSLPVADSPRSTRSAPWEDPRQRGLFSNSTNPSPRSVRSAGHRSTSRHHSHHRSPSVESEESCDSRRKRHHHHHRSRRNSDNDSERSHGSKCSHSHSHQSRRHRDRSDSRNRESGSESEASQKHRHGSRKHKSSSNYELVDSGAQWQEVQRQQKVGQQVRKPQSAVIRDLSSSTRKSGYVNSGMESESEAGYMHRRKHRKHRSRSRSPAADSKKGVPDELKKHFEYKLIEPSGMSDEQLKDIPYTKVEMEGKPFKVKYSPTSKHKQRTGTNRSTKSNASSDQKMHLTLDDDDGPPPPYTPNPHLAMAMTNEKPCSTSSPASSMRSQSARRNGQTNGYHGLDLLPTQFQEKMNGSVGHKMGQSTNVNSGDSILAVNGLTHLHHHEHSDSGLGNEGHGSSSGHTSGSLQSSASQSPNHMAAGTVQSQSFSTSINHGVGNSHSQHIMASHAAKSANNFGYYGQHHGQHNENRTLSPNGNPNGNNGTWYNMPAYRNHTNHSTGETSSIPNHQHSAKHSSVGIPNYYNPSFAPPPRPPPHFQHSNLNQHYSPYNNANNNNQRHLSEMMLNANNPHYPAMNGTSVGQSLNHSQMSSTPPPPLIPSRASSAHLMATQTYDPMMHNTLPGLKGHGVANGHGPHFQSRPNSSQQAPSHMAAYHTNSFTHNYNWAPNYGSHKRGMALPPHLDNNGFPSAEMVRRTENNHEMSTEL